MTEANLIKLTTEEISSAREVLGKFDIHLAVQALLAGDSPGEIYLDDKDDPRAALAWTMKRFFLAGRSDNRAFNWALREFFVEKIYPDALNKGTDGLTVFYAPEDWKAVIEDFILDGVHPINDLRHYYRCRELKHDWRERLPDGYSLVEVDQQLVENEELVNLDELVEEIHSECESVSAFLEQRFGICVLQGDQLVTWCLSEYNSAGRCEVGIATVPDHQRKGLATAASLALVEQALGKGFQEVGWHSYSGNAASIATALAAGFEKVSQYPAFWAIFDEAVNLAVNGDLCFERRDYYEAVDWYIRAVAAGGAPAWVYWNKACAHANLDQKEMTFDYLNQAIDHGFDDANHVQKSKHFEKWHGTGEWEAVIQRLQE